MLVLLINLCDQLNDPFSLLAFPLHVGVNKVSNTRQLQAWLQE